MRYLPKSPGERIEMLQQIGAGSIDDLFSTIPQEYRLERDLDVPRQMGESEIVDYFRQASLKSAAGYTSFLGAGAYRHYRPGDYRFAGAAGRVPHLLHSLPGGDYPGNPAGHLRVPDHDLRAHRHGDRQRLHVRRLDRRGRIGIHGCAHYPPHRGPGGQNGASRISRGDAAPTRSTRDWQPTTLAFGDDGRLDLAALEQSVTEETACVLVQSPNFFGVIEDIPAIAEIVHKKGALLIVSHRRGHFARRGAAAGRSRYRLHGSAIVRRGAQLWWSLLRGDRRQGKIPAADARPAGGRNRGQRKAAAALCSRSPPASSTSAGRRPPPTSAPTRRWWR